MSAEGYHASIRATEPKSEARLHSSVHVSRKRTAPDYISLSVVRDHPWDARVLNSYMTEGEVRQLITVLAEAIVWRP